MNTIQDYFTNAQLALAAYSDFSAGYDSSKLKQTKGVSIELLCKPSCHVAHALTWPKSRST